MNFHLIVLSFRFDGDKKQVDHEPEAQIGFGFTEIGEQ